MESEWIVFGEFGEYRANRQGVVQSRVRRGKPLHPEHKKRIVDEWQTLVPFKGRTDRFGGYYYSVNAFYKTRSPRLHVLICRLFNGEKPGSGYEVDHIDGNRQNNSADNLRWVSHAENMRNAKERDAWKRVKEKSFAFDSEEQFLSVMTQINAGVQNIELERRYGKNASKFSNLKYMKDTCGFVYRHRWLSKLVCKGDYFGGHKDFPFKKFGEN